MKGYTEIAAGVCCLAVAVLLILLAIDNMPPSQDELDGKIPMGPVNSGYVKESK